MTSRSRHAAPRGPPSVSVHNDRNMHEIRLPYFAPQSALKKNLRLR
jgi:hypothetical protein